MREILFRGKRLNNGKWVEGYFFRQYGINEIITADNKLYYHVAPETVGQYICKDKNGDKMFEGDIIKANDNLIGAVEWNDTFAKYIVCYNQISGNWFDFEGENCYPVALDCVIIGNIYDNPELLESEV